MAFRMVPVYTAAGLSPDQGLTQSDLKPVERSFCLTGTTDKHGVSKEERGLGPLLSIIDVLMLRKLWNL